MWPLLRRLQPQLRLGILKRLWHKGLIYLLENNKACKSMIYRLLMLFGILTCREEEIRTLDAVTHILPFQGSSFNHSDTSLCCGKGCKYSFYDLKCKTKDFFNDGELRKIKYSFRLSAAFRALLCIFQHPVLFLKHTSS